MIQILGETLAPFDEDGLIPSYGFGDISTKDTRVFPLKEGASTFDMFNQSIAAFTMLSEVEFLNILKLKFWLNWVTNLSNVIGWDIDFRLVTLVKNLNLSIFKNFDPWVPLGLSFLN